MRRALVLACVLFAGLVPTPGNAFDDARRGFLLGGSIGPGAQLYSANRPNPPGSLSSAAIATSVRMGWGLDPKTEIYLFSSGVTSLQFYYIPLPYTSTVSGLGFRRYFSGSASRLFAGVGAGVGSTSAILSWQNWGNGSGLGLMGNLGYEHKKHWSVELEWDYANLAPVPPYDDPNTPISSVTMLSVKFSGTAY